MYLFILLENFMLVQIMLIIQGEHRGGGVTTNYNFKARAKWIQWEDSPDHPRHLI